MDVQLNNFNSICLIFQLVINDFSQTLINTANFLLLEKI